jgi:hypothetical protein
MPDFDTRKPQEPDEPSRHRIASTADTLRALLVAARSRVPSIANRVRSLWSVTTLRALLIGGGILFLVAVAVPIGLLIYPYGGKGNQQVAEGHSSGGIDDQQWEAKNANLEPLAACSSNRSGHEREVLDDDSSAKKIVFASGPQTTASSSGTMSDNLGHPNTGMYVINADSSGLTQLTRTTATEFEIPDSLLLDDSEIESLFTYDTNVVASAESSDQTVCSPDRKKLAFVLYRIKYTPYTPSGHRDVKLPVRYDMYVVNDDGTGLTRLTHTEALEEKVIAWVGG